MEIFGNYSRYYDLLYQDKNYLQESNFVHKLLLKYTTDQPQSLLELGSGTGRHAYHLAQKNYDIHGIEQSGLMLEMAGNFLTKEDKAISQKITLVQGDIRHINLSKKFDSAISLFHVMSYQTTNSDLDSVFQTVKNHVKSDGIFIFDCWYGPAVLSQLPQVRYKSMKNAEFNVDRIAIPTLLENENIVKVHFDLFVQQKNHSAFYKMEEDHFMRYLFYPEIEALCDKFGMTIQTSCEWLTSRPLSKETWGACFVIKL